MIGILLISGISYGIYISTTHTSGNEVFLSTTTSVQNTGLLDYLITHFEQNHNLQVKYTAVGSGAAIQLARDGEVDAVLVHAPNLEFKLIADGFSDQRHTLWYNYFVIAGPASDPANITTTTTASEAFTHIYEAGRAGKATFYSRGDQSGTNIKEEMIWNQTGYTINPKAPWYYATGTGMAATLFTADNDPRGYCLTDVGTFTKLKAGSPPLQKEALFNHDDLLYNPYSYLIINASRTHTSLNTAGAITFLNYLTDPATTKLVSNYKVGNFTLFNPINSTEG